MSMLEINVDALSLNIRGAAGHEHRVRPIAARAAAIFSERLEQHSDEVPESARQQRYASRVDLDLTHMSDEQAAGRIAESWFNALILGLH